MFETPFPFPYFGETVATLSLLTNRGVNEWGSGDILYYMCGMCVQGRVVRPLLLHHVNTSAQALQLVGGMRERRNKQCAKIATSVLQLCSFCFFDKIIACSDADAHTFASLCCSLYTLYLFKLTVATGRTQSSLPRLHNRIGTCTSHLVWG